MAFSEEENKALRAALRKFKADHDLSQKAVGDAIGIEQQNAGRLLGPSPHVGMSTRTGDLLAVRLGYKDAKHFLLEHGVLAELQTKKTGTLWFDRDIAARIAIKLPGVPQSAIDAVIARYSRNEDINRQMTWWIGKFLVEATEMAAAAASPQPLPQAIRPIVVIAKKTSRKSRRTG